MWFGSAIVKLVSNLEKALKLLIFLYYELWVGLEIIYLHFSLLIWGEILKMFKKWPNDFVRLVEDKVKCLEQSLFLQFHFVYEFTSKKKKRLLNRFLWRFLKLSVRRNEEWCAILWLPHPAGNSLSDRKSTYRLNNQQWSSSSAILFVCHASSLLFRGRLLVWSPQCPLISFMSELSLMLILEALLCV